MDALTCSVLAQVAAGKTRFFPADDSPEALAELQPLIAALRRLQALGLLEAAFGPRSKSLQCRGMERGAVVRRLTSQGTAWSALGCR
ncbi:hypothetical protein [Caldimonas tepidiphila]|uniref:hypothetical protein n=1 Tax=Caldimonas tepidiphila TaxID=2315841 RepID=UPI000E5B1ACA|nr:hypothetical protein [Caldimonas tepidiphila]